MRLTTLYNCMRHVEELSKENNRLHYHNFLHVYNVLYENEKLGFNDDALYLAIIFHDVVYDPMKKDNEEKSCEYFRSYMGNMLNEVMISTVENLIMVTKHDGRANTDLEKIICDLDLSILSANTIRYDNYAKNIEREYRYYISEKEYLTGRIKFLNTLLCRPSIYYNSYMNNDCAFANIKREVITLEKRSIESI